MFALILSRFALDDEDEFRQLLRCVRDETINNLIVEPAGAYRQRLIQTFPSSRGHCTGGVGNSRQIGLKDLIHRSLLLLHRSVYNLPPLPIFENFCVLIEEVIHFVLLLLFLQGGRLWECISIRVVNFKHVAVLVV